MMWIVKRQGKLMGVADSYNEAWVFVLKNQGQSVDYALTHGGWEITEVG